MAAPRRRLRPGGGQSCAGVRAFGAPPWGSTDRDYLLLCRTWEDTSAKKTSQSLQAIAAAVVLALRVRSASARRDPSVRLRAHGRRLARAMSGVGTVGSVGGREGKGMQASFDVWNNAGHDVVRRRGRRSLERRAGHDVVRATEGAFFFLSLSFYLGRCHGAGTRMVGVAEFTLVSVGDRQWR